MELPKQFDNITQRVIDDLKATLQKGQSRVAFPWAIVFKENAEIKHIYFVVETKGYKEDEVMDYRNSENVKIACARRHFETISNSTVKYEVVNNYAELRKK